MLRTGATFPTLMHHFERLFENNRRFAASMLATDPDFFRRRAQRQEPHFLFIGCSDSRVPVELLTGVQSGEMFVHRNIANQAAATDLNALSVLQFAVETLNVEHVIVLGHLQCGGVSAAMGASSGGLVDHWLAGIRETMRRHEEELARYPDEERRFARLVELNVLRQVYQLSQTPIVRAAWQRHRRPTLHGLVYDVSDGLLRAVVSGVDSPERAKSELDAYH